MQRLPNPNLVGSSMQAGNTTSDAPGLVMTAPGSPSVLPVPDNPDRLPMPEFTNDTPIPVSNQHGRVEGNPAPAQTGPWHDITEGGNGGWRQL